MNKHQKNTLIIVTLGVGTSAINKLIMNDVYARYRHYDKIYLVVDRPDQTNQSYYYKLFYGFSNAKLVLPYYFFTWLKNNISNRFFSKVSKWDLKIALLRILFSNLFHKITINNYNFRKELPRFTLLNKIMDIVIRQEIHSMDAKIGNFKNHNKMVYCFANEFQYAHYLRKYPNLKMFDLEINPYNILTTQDYNSKINYNIIRQNHTIKRHLIEVEKFCSKFEFNLVYFGRYIEAKGIKELCTAVKNLADKKIGLSLYGMSSLWFNKWFSEEFANCDNIKDFGGPYVDLELVLKYYQLNCLLSESEVGPLTIMECMPFGIKTLVKDRLYAHQSRFSGFVIILSDNQIANSLEEIIQEQAFECNTS